MKHNCEPWQFSIYPSILVTIVAISYFSTLGGGLLLESIFTEIWKLISSTPDHEFLSDVAAVEAVFLGIAIPVTFQVVHRLSDNYNTPSIYKRFLSHKITKFTPIFLAANIALSVFLTYSNSSATSNSTYTFLERVTMLGLLVAFILSFIFFILAWKYTTDTDFVMSKMFSTIESVIEDADNES